MTPVLYIGGAIAAVIIADSLGLTMEGLVILLILATPVVLVFLIIRALIRVGDKRPRLSS
ncbi:hypothetical protein ABZW96_36155 [Nocardia sp. NPDC004168]|uniref:hypothetical protein n=1 Tax=Nocardia sp. NPDC004168 TaxID=3154452 RepID=UPI0033A3A1D9